MRFIVSPQSRLAQPIVYFWPLRLSPTLRQKMMAGRGSENNGPKMMAQMMV
jgi:hypothetical protein